MEHVEHMVVTVTGPYVIPNTMKKSGKHVGVQIALSAEYKVETSPRIVYVPCFTVSLKFCMLWA